MAAKAKATKRKAPTPTPAAPTRSPGQWDSRIVGHDRVAPDQLLAHPLNYRRHPQAQRDALRDAIAEVGFIRSVTVNKRTGNLIDGHERVWQALQTEQPFIDVEYVDLSEADEMKALATMDPISEMAKVNQEMLDTLLREVQTGSEALSKMLTDLAGTPPDDAGDTSSQLDGMSFKVLIDCSDESEQTALLERFNEEGLTCRALIT